jgi:hypothetical protein
MKDIKVYILKNTHKSQNTTQKQTTTHCKKGKSTRVNNIKGCLF